MTNFVLFDGAAHKNLLPLTYTKPVAKLRVGIYTILEKWEKLLKQPVGVRTKDYLNDRFQGVNERAEIGIYAAALPNEAFLEALMNLKENQLLMQGDQVLAISPLPAMDEMDELIGQMAVVPFESEIDIIENTWDLFKLNGSEIKRDFSWVKKNLKPSTIDKSNVVLGSQVFVEEGAKVRCAVLNSEEGPVFISKNSEVMEGSLIRGPFALCEGASVKMGAKIYGSTTIGPYCKVGGEVGNSIMMAFSNKGHDGYMGNSVIGEWCNLGADTNTSNLKNNYGSVKVWSEKEMAYMDSGETFCGLVMADHAKCGINTMFNTGTVVGVFANVFGGGFPENMIPSFAWGGVDSLDLYDIDKAIEVAKAVMARRNLELALEDESILRDIHRQVMDKYGV